MQKVHSNSTHANSVNRFKLTCCDTKNRLTDSASARTEDDKGSRLSRRIQAAQAAKMQTPTVKRREKPSTADAWRV